MEPLITSHELPFRRYCFSVPPAPNSCPIPHPVTPKLADPLAPTWLTCLGTEEILFSKRTLLASTLCPLAEASGGWHQGVGLAVSLVSPVPTTWLLLELLSFAHRVRAAPWQYRVCCLRSSLRLRQCLAEQLGLMRVMMSE